MRNSLLATVCLCAVAMDEVTAEPRDFAAISRLADAGYPIAAALPEDPGKYVEFAAAGYPIAVPLPQDPDKMTALADAGYSIAVPLPQDPDKMTALADARYPIVATWPQVPAESPKTWSQFIDLAAQSEMDGYLITVPSPQMMHKTTGLAATVYPTVATWPQVPAEMAERAKSDTLDLESWSQFLHAAAEQENGGSPFAVPLLQMVHRTSELADAGYLVAVALTQMSDMSASMEGEVDAEIECIILGGSWESCVPGANDWRKRKDASGWLDGTTYDQVLLDALMDAFAEQDEESPWYGAIVQGPRWGVSELVPDAYAQPLLKRDSALGPEW